jgi:hypothetical protein
MALYQSGAGLGALVGVGTTNPTSNLQVYGTPIAAGNVFSVLNTAASGNVAQFSSSTGTALIINSIGNVGIGTTNPTSNLQVVGNVLSGNVISSVAMYGVLAGSNTIGASTVSATTVSATSLVGTQYGVIAGANTIACSSVTAQGTAAEGAIYLTGRAIEIGQGQTSDTSAYIDLHTAEGTYPDYAFRIIRYGGANGNAHWVNRGGGNSYFQNQDSGAGGFYFQSGGLDIGAITQGGVIYFGKAYTAQTGSRPGYNQVVSYDCGTPATPVASTVYYGQSVVFGSGSTSGKMWNNSGAPTFYAADTFLQAAQCYDGTNNGTGAANQYAGNLYLDGGLAWCLGGSGTTNQCYAGAIYFRTGLSGGGLTTGTPTNRMVIMPNTGYVGIGTNNPGYLIDGEVNANINGGAQIRNSSTGTAAITAWRLGNGNGTNRGGIALFGSGYTSGSVYLQDGAYVYGGGAGGLTLNTEAAYPIYFATNNSERMRITSGGNVGIGITNPGAVLTVVGGSSTPVVQIHDSSSGGPDYGASYGMVNLTRGADTVKAHVAFIRAGNFVWQMGYIQNTNAIGMFPFNFSGTQGTPTMTWSGGNVGIGTTSPVAKLDVYTTGHGIRQTDSGGGAQVEFYTNTTAGWVGTFNNYPLYFFTNNSAVQMILSTAGYLGIGASPACQLYLYNSGTGGQIGIAQQNDNVGYYRMGMETNWGAYSALNAYWTGSGWNYVSTGGYSGTAVMTYMLSGFWSVNTASGGTNPVSWTERMRVTNGGYVGIVQSSPLARLHVQGDANSGSGYGHLLVDYPNASSAGGCITIRNSGSGVGAFASLIFEVDGSTSCTSSTTPTGFGQGNGMLYCQNVGPSSAAKMGIIQWTGGSEVETVTILPSGNVGIGTTNPGYLLHVYNGDSSTVRFGPNATWGASLNVGSGTQYNSGTSGVASVISTNGNLHIDSGTGQILYIQYFTAGGGVGGTTYSYGTWTHNGTFYCTGDIYAFSSDERLKTKTGLIENALDKVCSLDTFTYVPNDIAKSLGCNEDKEKLGVSAQQVQKVAPQVVAPAPCDIESEGPKKGQSKTGQNYLTVQYDRLVPLLIEALKEERKSREALEERIKILEQK